MTTGKRIVKNRGISRALGKFLYDNKNVDVDLRTFRKDMGLPADHDLSSALWYLRSHWNMEIKSVIPGLVYRFVGEVGSTPKPPEAVDVAERARIEQAQERISVKEQAALVEAEMREKAEQAKPRSWEELAELPETGDCLLWRNDETIWRATQLR